MSLLVAAVIASETASTDGWLRAPGMNACGTGCGVHKDFPGHHFVGLLPNATACEATCLAHPTSNCSIWLWSSSSQSCWWRTDGVWEPSPQSTIVSACRETASPGAKCVPGCGACPAATTPAPTPLPPVISGSGKFKYQYDPSKLVLPASVKLVNGHGLARDKAGNIYFTYESSDKSDAGARAILLFAPDGSGGTLLGDDNSLAQGVPHGIKVQQEADGVEYLYHANSTCSSTCQRGQRMRAVISMSVCVAWSARTSHLAPDRVQHDQIAKLSPGHH
jgi:hypothetical protein